MTFVVATLGSAGDLHPFLAVARALHEQGEAVLFLSQEPHRAEVEAQGLAFEPIISAHDHWRTVQHPDLWHPIRGFGVLWRHLALRALQPTYDILERLSAASSAPVKVLASPLVVGARLACERLPIRLCTGHTAPAGLRSCADPMFVGSRPVPGWLPRPLRSLLWHGLDRYKLEPMAATVLNAWRRRHGLAPIDGPVFGGWIHSPQQVIALFPPDFGPMPSDWPLRSPALFCGFPLYEAGPGVAPDPELAAFVAPEDRPLLVFYPGSAATPAQREMQAAAVDMARQGMRSLLIGQAPDLPPIAGLLGRPWVRLPAVLPQAQLAVHHGGIGMVAQCLAAGARQLVRPSAYDQFDNAWRLAPDQWRARAHRPLAAQIQQALRAPWTPATPTTTPTYSRPGQPNAAVVRAVDALRRL